MTSLNLCVFSVALESVFVPSQRPAGLLLLSRPFIYSNACINSTSHHRDVIVPSHRLSSTVSSSHSALSLPPTQQQEEEEEQQQHAEKQRDSVTEEDARVHEEKLEEKRSVVMRERERRDCFREHELPDPHIVETTPSTTGIRPALAWLKETYEMKGSDVSRLRGKLDRALTALRSADPSRISLSVELDLVPKAELLEALSPGLTLKVLSRYPEEFAHPDAADYWRIMAALVYTAGFTPQAVEDLFGRHICLFARTVQDPENLHHLFQWLHDLGLGQGHAMRLIDRHPLILQTNVESVLVPRVSFMAGLVGDGDEKKAITAVRRHPELLGVDSNFLQTRVEFFVNDVGLSERDVGRLFVAQPALFTCSIDANLRPAISSLRDELGLYGDALESQSLGTQEHVDFEGLLQRLIISGGVLSRSPQTIAHRVWLWRRLGLCPHDLRKALWRFPRLLLYPIDTPKYSRKLQFLQQEMGSMPSAALTSFPQFISYSLEKRIVPRFAIAKELCGVVPHLSVFALKDDAFYKAMGITAETASAFLREWQKTEKGSLWMGDRDLKDRATEW